MNAKTQKALIELCAAIKSFAMYNPMAETNRLQEACAKARDCIENDETVIETEPREDL